MSKLYIHQNARRNDKNIVDILFVFRILELKMIF